ncbi:MAG: methyltransferase domain-containing protein [Candidatus Moraniibacteriota bacterium]
MQNNTIDIEVCEGLVVKRTIKEIISERMNPRIWQWAYLSLRALLREVKIFSGMLERERAEKMLDLGCGVKPYRSLFPEVRAYVGFDVSRDSGADFFGFNWELPFGESEFDALISTQVLEHTLKIHETIKEIKRVVKNDGLIFISVPLAFPEHEIPHDYYRFTQYGLRELFEGFEVIKICPLSGYLKTLIILWNNFLHYLPGSKYWLFPLFAMNNFLALAIDKVALLVSSMLFKMSGRAVIKEIYAKYYASFTESYVVILRNRK